MNGNRGECSNGGGRRIRGRGRVGAEGVNLMKGREGRSEWEQERMKGRGKREGRKRGWGRKEGQKR